MRHSMVWEAALVCIYVYQSTSYTLQSIVKPT